MKKGKLTIVLFCDKNDAKEAKMVDESRDLKNEDGTGFSDFLDLAFGLLMIVIPLAAIAEIAWKGNDFGAYLVWVILFICGSLVGGLMMRDGWRNLKKRRKNG